MTASGSSGNGSTGGTTIVGPSSNGGTSTSTTAASGGDAIEDPNAKGKATIERLRTGVSTTNSGQ